MAQPFAIGKFAVTFEDYDRFCKSVKINKLDHPYPNTDSDRGRQPVNHRPFSWNNAVAYCKWLSQQTGKSYRLPSEAEWEYCCRAGTTTPFFWGSTITTDEANYNGKYEYGTNKEVNLGCRGKTVPVEKFAPNAFGLHQMHGNVAEWCQDRQKNRYDGAPTDGSAWEEFDGNAPSRVSRGGDYNSSPEYCRSASRDKPSSNNPVVGVRVVVELPLPANL